MPHGGRERGGWAAIEENSPCRKEKRRRGIFLPVAGGHRWEKWRAGLLTRHRCKSLGNKTVGKWEVKHEGRQDYQNKTGNTQTRDHEGERNILNFYWLFISPKNLLKLDLNSFPNVHVLVLEEEPWQISCRQIWPIPGNPTCNTFALRTNHHTVLTLSVSVHVY